MDENFFEFVGGAAKPHIVQYPWMKSKQMTLVTKDTLDMVIDKCIAAGRYAIDLETTGLDNRVFNALTVCSIVGICLAPNENEGFYIPVGHQGFEGNLPWTQTHAAIKRLLASKAIAIMHNAKFDQEFMQFAPHGPMSDFEDYKKWEDTLIKAYVRNPKAKNKGLKHLSKTRLGWEMIELSELFGGKPPFDFSLLDPTWDPVLWYACSDAICTFALDKLLSEPVTLSIKEQLAKGVSPMDTEVNIFEPDGCGITQKNIYEIEKANVIATRWMERPRIKVDVDKVKLLIRIGQKDWITAVSSFYEEAQKLLGRDIRPAYWRYLIANFDPEDINTTFDTKVDVAKKKEEPKDLTEGKCHVVKGKIVPLTLTKRVYNIEKPTLTVDTEFPRIYDLRSPAQVGLLLWELGVPGLSKTETGQISTDQDALEQVIKSQSEKFPVLKLMQKFRENEKGLSGNLLPLLEDTDPSDHTMRVQFNAYRVDTGRFSTKGEKGGLADGGTRYNMHSTPSPADPDRPECLRRIRECFIAEDEETTLVSIDWSGVELRIVTNLSGEPKWVTEFFRCSSCGKTFDQGDGVKTPPTPPPYCPDCGSDKIGDLHTLTGIEIFGSEAPKQENWKKKRGEAKCVHPDTLILTQNATSEGLKLRPIKDLSFGGEDTFQTVQGVSVYTGHGTVPVLETYNGGQKMLYNIVTRRGILTCSENHKVQCADGSLRSIADGLSRGQVLADVETIVLPFTCDETGISFTDGLSLRSKLHELGTRLPQGVCSNNTRTWEFVEGLFCGWTWVIVHDPIFAGQIAALLQCLGCLVKISLSGEGQYRVELQNTDVDLTRDRDGYLSRGNEVLSIIPYGMGPCLDLHLDSEEHLYWTNGVIGHNSCNFALLYGGGGNAVVRATGCDENEGWRIKKVFDKSYETLHRYWMAQHQFVRDHGYVITAFGRRCPLPDIYASIPGFVAKAERNSVNAPIQGFSADLMKLSMFLIYKECKKRGWMDKVKMIITIHDELVFQIKNDILQEAIETFTQIMTRTAIKALPWRVPLAVDVEFGSDWTVPYNYFKYKYGQAKKPLPEKWARLFDFTRKEEVKPSEGPKDPDKGTTITVVPEQAAERQETVTVQESMDAQKVTLTKGAVYSWVLLSPLSLSSCERLSRVIAQQDGKGPHPLKIELPDGTVVWSDNEGIRVSPVLFPGAADGAELRGYAKN